MLSGTTLGFARRCDLCALAFVAAPLRNTAFGIVEYLCVDLVRGVLFG
jgi:hypothetical protein